MRDFSELDRQIDNAHAHAIDENAKGRKWSQISWVAPCGTYGCIAGNALLDSGMEAYQINVDMYDTDEEFDRMSVTGASAARLLGLTQDEGLAVFDSLNSIGVLRKLQKDLHNGEPITVDTAWKYQDEEVEDE